MSDNTPKLETETQQNPDTKVTGLTIGQLITRLQELDPETIVTINEWDTDYGIDYTWSVSGIDPDGSLIHGDIISTNNQPRLNTMIDEQEG